MPEFLFLATLPGFLFWMTHLVKGKWIILSSSPPHGLLSGLGTYMLPQDVLNEFGERAILSLPLRFPTGLIGSKSSKNGYYTNNNFKIPFERTSPLKKLKILREEPPRSFWRGFVT